VLSSIAIDSLLLLYSGSLSDHSLSSLLEKDRLANSKEPTAADVCRQRPGNYYPSARIMPGSPSLRRIQADIRELALHPSDRYVAAPLEHDMFEWHFTIAGPTDSEFTGGMYHGRILLPPDYPFKPPHIVFLTKSGRFETNVKVCLSFSAFHPELWQPAWGIRLILEALIAFLPTPADGAIGALNYTKEERQKLAKLSTDYYCPVCQKKCSELLQPLPPLPATVDDETCRPVVAAGISFSKEIEALKLLQQQEHATTTAASDKKEEHDEADEALATTNHKDDNDTDDDADDAAAPTTVDTTTLPEPLEGTATTNAAAPDDGPNHGAAAPPPVVPERRRVVPDHPAAVADLQLPPPALSTTLDPYLHAAILLLSIVVGLLLRKIQLLVDDLNALDEGK
jgi:ubiquitin-conjugating enzyme E2 J1